MADAVKGDVLAELKQLFAHRTSELHTSSSRTPSSVTPAPSSAPVRKRTHSIANENSEPPIILRLKNLLPSPLDQYPVTPAPAPEPAPAPAPEVPVEKKPEPTPEATPEEKVVYTTFEPHTKPAPEETKKEEKKESSSAKRHKGS